MLFTIAAVLRGCPTDNAAVYFAPQQPCAAKIAEVIATARHSIDAAIYIFTSRPLAQALVRAHERGVQVRVCLDGRNPSDSYSKRVFLEQKGITVKLVSGEGIMHHKFCVVDKRLVITGSFNWTASADLRNDENLLLLRSPALARKYAAEFDRLWHARKIDAAQYSDEARAHKKPLPGTIHSGVFKQKALIYVASQRSKRFHRKSCRWAQKISQDNRIEFTSREEAVRQGYKPCRSCNP